MRLYLTNLLKNYLEPKLNNKTIISKDKFDTNFYFEKLNEKYENSEIFLLLEGFEFNNKTQYSTETTKVKGEVISSFKLILKAFNDDTFEELEEAVLDSLNKRFSLNNLIYNLTIESAKYKIIQNELGPDLLSSEIKVKLIAPLIKEKENKKINFKNIKIKGELNGG